MFVSGPENFPAGSITTGRGGEIFFCRDFLLPFSGLRLIAFSATPFRSYRVRNAKEKPSVARSCDHVGDLEHYDKFVQVFRVKTILF
jgi:hypothetical protein